MRKGEGPLLDRRRTLGWGVVEGSGLKYAGVEYGTVKSSPKLSFPKRLAKIYDGVAEVIETWL